MPGFRNQYMRNGFDLWEDPNFNVLSLELPVITRSCSGFPVLITATCCGKTSWSLLPCAKSHCLPQRKSYLRKSAHLWGTFLVKIFTSYSSLLQWLQFKYTSVPFLMFLIFLSKTVGLPPFTSLYLKLGVLLCQILICVHVYVCMHAACMLHAWTWSRKDSLRGIEKCRVSVLGR